jgi:hypothetical protein
LKPSTLRAWIKRRRLKHHEAAELLALSVAGLRKNLYGITPIGPQTARIVELLDKWSAEAQSNMTATTTPAHVCSTATGHSITRHQE